MCGGDGAAFGRVGLLGTRFTMQGVSIQKPFQTRNQLVYLSSEQSYIDRYVTELVNGVLPTRDGL